MSDTTQLLQTLIDRQRKESFVDGANVSDGEVLGVVIAHYCGWDGVQILETAASALEDANFHTESEQVDQLRNNIRGQIGVE